jgi:Fur family ferric uptake transcriptional regulator
MRLSLNSNTAGRRPQRAARALRDYLSRRGLRMTGEREALLRAALERGTHFTLDELAQDVMRSDSSASRATVYRSLPILVEAGILQPALVTGEVRRFELALGRRHHDHLLCRGCGRIVEFRSEAIERLQLEIAGRHGFRLTSHVHELFGDCAACRPAGRARRAAVAAGAASAAASGVRRGAAGKRR